MATPSGISAQLGVKAETTYGTAVTVTRFVPLVDESIESNFEPLESAGIIAGAHTMRSTQWSQGVWRHQGDIGLELHDRTIGLFLHHALGSVSTSGTQAPYTHTITPADMTGLGMTVQVGRPDRTGTVRPFTFAGVKIASWEIACAAGEIATLGLSVVAQTMTTGTSLASAAISQSIQPMTFTGGSFSLAGSSLAVRSFRLSGDNSLDVDRVQVGQDYIDEPINQDLRVYTGEIELEFPDLVHWERFVAGTEGTLTAAITRGTSSLTITGNVRTDAATPTVQGRGMLVQTMSFTCVASTTNDASALKMTYVTSDSQP